jgi:hypothetical protein
MQISLSLREKLSPEASLCVCARSVIWVLLGEERGAAKKEGALKPTLFLVRRGG